MSIMNEKTVSRKKIFGGRILDLEVVEVELATGKTSTREIVRHRGAVVVVAVLPNRRMVLVRQYRKAVEESVLEFVAGLLEEGEDPDECAVREIREETGHEVASIKKLGAIWPSPGYTDERLHVFHAELVDGPAPLRLDEGECLEVHTFTEIEVRQMISSGEICDGKTLAALLLWQELR